MSASSFSRHLLLYIWGFGYLFCKLLSNIPFCVVLCHMLSFNSSIVSRQKWVPGCLWYSINLLLSTHMSKQSTQSSLLVYFQITHMFNFCIQYIELELKKENMGDIFRVGVGLEMIYQRKIKCLDTGWILKKNFFACWNLSKRINIELNQDYCSTNTHFKSSVCQELG